MCVMLHAFFRLLMLVVVSLAVACIATDHSPAQESKQPTAPAPVYLPPGQTDASVLSVILASLREPSLLEAAKDTTVRSFRVTYFSPVPVHEVAVRLIVNADGSGQITSSVSSGAETGVGRTTNNVSKEDVDKLFELIDKAGFWATLSTESTEPQPMRQVANSMFLMGLGGCWKEYKTARSTMSSVEIQNHLQSRKSVVIWQRI